MRKHRPATQSQPRKSFPLGTMVMTPGIVHLQASGRISPMELLGRHATGDWGDLAAEDKAANEAALRTGGRLYSNYQTKAGSISIITEADRSATTLLLPCEY
jgi:hypothetical protein